MNALRNTVDKNMAPVKYLFLHAVWGTKMLMLAVMTVHPLGGRAAVCDGSFAWAFRTTVVACKPDVLRGSHGVVGCNIYIYIYCEWLPRVGRVSTVRTVPPILDTSQGEGIQ